MNSGQRIARGLLSFRLILRKNLPFYPLPPNSFGVNHFPMRLLRFLFKDLFRSLQTAGGRQFLWLLLRYADRPRNQSFWATVGPFRFRVIDGLSFAWQYKEIFTDEFYRFETTEIAPVIYDCGANIGMSIAYFRQQHPNARIVAFEADPGVGGILADNLKTNDIHNVELINKAVWINSDGVDFGAGEADAGSMFSSEGRQRVPSIRLRDYLLREPRIDMVKIDIEGAEADVLTDCHDALTNVQNLFIEYHSYFGHPQALAGILALLETNGFRYYVDTNQHRTRPFITRRYKGNDIMDLQLNVFAYRE